MFVAPQRCARIVGGSEFEPSATMDTLVSQLTILVVDDEPLIRWSISETLGTAGHRVTEAEDAASALRALACMPPPDVVLLDLRLPDSNDLRLLEKIHTIAPAAM